MKLICSTKYSLDKNEKKRVIEILSYRKENIYNTARYGYHRTHHQKHHKHQHIQEEIQEIDECDRKISPEENDVEDSENEIEDDEEFENYWIQEKIASFVELNTKIMENIHEDKKIDDNDEDDNNRLFRIIMDCTLQTINDNN